MISFGIVTCRLDVILLTADIMKLNRKQQRAAALLILLRCKRRILKQARTRRKWCRTWIARHDTHGAFNNLQTELQTEDVDSFQNFLRIDTSSYQELLNKVKPLIERQDTNFRLCIKPGERLSITLRFLATGELFNVTGLYQINENYGIRLESLYVRFIYNIYI